MNGKIATSKLCNYELYQLATNYIMDEEGLTGYRNLGDRYHVVDYNSKTMVTAKTMDKAIQNANRAQAFSPRAIIDEKNLVAWDLKVSIWGAGHTIYTHAVRRY